MPQDMPYPPCAPVFFEQTRFREDLEAALASGAATLSIFKSAIKAADAHLENRFREGEEVRNLVYDRALFTDCILHYAWHQFRWSSGIALIAVGGYGRGELHPHSDVDLLILLDDALRASCPDETAGNIESFVTMLWDLGLDIGHSVRGISETITLAQDDITVATNLMESRTVTGDPALHEALQKLVAPDNIWPAEAFFIAKRDEQIERHAEFRDTEYNLEPNIKKAPGGLRDIQTIAWVTKRYFGVNTLKSLQGKGFFTEDEFAILQSGEEFLWRVRYGLHLVSGRADERLLFDYQRELAKMFGYEDNKRLAVEQFMHDYYRVVLALRELNDVLLQYLNEVILQRGRSQRVEPLNERFQLRDGFLEATQIFVFRENPSALLEVFLLLANHPEIKGVRASTIRLLRENRHLIDERYRANPENAQLFMELLRSPHALATQLTRMSRYGILGRYLPEFGKVTGQMQHDLFHIYTVDAHTLQVVRNMRRFRHSDAEKKFPVAAEIMQRLPKPELLYISGLYHDIAKGRGGDHSTLGAVDAADFCKRHGLSARDTRLVCWLVEKHLLMSQVAQKSDISDPDVIHEFAREVGDRQHLDYLYALTVADINATNPDLWNSWRASLMRQLFQTTRNALKRGLENPIDRLEIIAETRLQALQLLGDQVPEEEVTRIWAQMGEDYFVRETAGSIAWHTAAIAQAENPSGAPLVLTRNTGTGKHDGATEIFIYTLDRANVFAAAASAIDQLHLSIHDAHLYSSASGYTLDTFYVLQEDGRPLPEDPELGTRISQMMQGELSLLGDCGRAVERRTSRRLKMFPLKTHAIVDTEPGANFSTLEVTSADRPGLLARIARCFMRHEISLLNAKIATLGERIEDIFHIVDAEGNPLRDPESCRSLEEDICKSLDAQIE
ncbi:[protein-PII] uridylyltransferase [Biformimicrobium ophioploci]|uniref:Bifunctional uridylyltransferase/uridylyl-removing enzyme n=1 Tax=Biformimicrobium ophioploci TaxID=3036711 RepID=A0ABQ6LZN3_9GAMM|nr:[protein-PII] uridylyltransferase [Microbulbifer sp. NKW57]GMG87502.1 [protein-PII] uridylyltransferase [Microbulbifer sp. NKW57]